MTTLERFQAILSRYHDALVTALESDGLVPEFLATATRSDRPPRLLCQTRGIIYLVHFQLAYAHPPAAKRAAKLYEEMRPRYLRHHDGRYTPPAQHDGGARYELAFLLNAQVQLAELEPLEGLDDDLNATLDDILSAPFDTWLQPRAGGDFLELNALMHLFEALAIAQRYRPQPRIATHIERIAQVASERFLDTEHGLLAERIAEDGRLLEYDLGHNYEWASLLLLNADLGLDFAALDPKTLCSASERVTLASFAPRMISNRLDAERRPMAFDARIWVNLERLRCLALSGSPLAEPLLEEILDAYFPADLPEEYLGQRGPIKSTTGYHVIECYRAVAGTY